MWSDLSTREMVAGLEALGGVVSQGHFGVRGLLSLKATGY